MREFFILGEDANGETIEETVFAVNVYSLYYGFECEHPGGIILSYVEIWRPKI